MIIYKITNKINNKIYIGQTTKTKEERLKKHYIEALSKQRNNKPDTYFHNALLKYGLDNFFIEEIDSANNIEELNEKEIFWIKTNNSTNRTIGYNLSSGGKSGLKNEDTKRKIGEKKKENWQNPELADKMMKGLEKATLAWQKKCKDNLVGIVCKNCGKIFFVQPYFKNIRLFCSQECSRTYPREMSPKATEKKIELKKERDFNIKKEVELWARNNKEIIQKCPYNKISTTLIDVYAIANKYGISDWRIISQAVCEKASRKELLKYLKSL